jgi:hypothetical protein
LTDREIGEREEEQASYHRDVDREGLPCIATPVKSQPPTTSSTLFTMAS